MRYAFYLAGLIAGLHLPVHALPPSQDVPVVKLSPRIRSSKPADTSLPKIPAGAIEPFLTEVLVVDPQEFARAPRIVAAPEGRVLLSSGDRAYARGEADTPLLLSPNSTQLWRVFRNAQALTDPATGNILGYEAQYVGRARLLSGESHASGDAQNQIVPAMLEIVSAQKEIRIGDRLVAESTRELQSYTPQVPQSPIQGQIVAAHNSMASFAAEKQIVILNRGSLDGLKSGHVLAVLKTNTNPIDVTDTTQTRLQLPPQRNGLLLVFRTFEHVAYALVLQMTDAVRVGDTFVNP